ncbi:methyltransferase domain-containing protein [Salix suchowensis]|nr:methyltransferase domain-containing protein [Salix suchowensis]
MQNMKPKPAIVVYFVISLILSLPLLFFFFFCFKTNTYTPPDENPISGLRIRPGYTTYKTYIQRQLNKTLNPKLRKIWTTRDWDRKIQVFADFFQVLKQKNLLFNESKALCIGARVGQEVEALRRIGVSDSVGMDLVPYPPLVVRGDFHHQPFDDGTFDFEFSNVFDHALFPDKFVGEIERTLKPGGICVLHVALSRRADKYSANDLFSVKPLVNLFTNSKVVHVRKVDGFGLDTEVVFRKTAKKDLEVIRGP